MVGDGLSRAGDTCNIGASAAAGDSVLLVSRHVFQTFQYSLMLRSPRGQGGWVIDECGGCEQATPEAALDAACERLTR